MRYINYTQVDRLAKEEQLDSLKAKATFVIQLCALAGLFTLMGLVVRS